MIDGSGRILNDKTEQGVPLPFMTTDRILLELQRFGFYIKYDVRSNLPDNILAFLATVDNLGYDKISQVLLETKIGNETKWLPTPIVFKAVESNNDILTFNCKLSRAKFDKKLEANTLMNISVEKGMKWDWLKYIANIEDILNENIDPKDEFETKTNIQTGQLTPYNQENHTPYDSEEIDDFTEGG